MDAGAEAFARGYLIDQQIRDSKEPDARLEEQSWLNTNPRKYWDEAIVHIEEARTTWVQSVEVYDAI